LAAKQTLKTTAKESLKKTGKQSVKGAGKGAGKTGKVHGNSSKYIGDTHVYVVRNAQGKIHKVGESMKGVNKYGQSRRAEAQVRKLKDKTGKGFESEVRRNFPDKASARAYETKLIQRYRKMFGNDQLPGNKGVH
jgi:hypothetical protein